MSSRLYEPYKNNRLSFSELPDLPQPSLLNPALGPAQTAQDLVPETLPPIEENIMAMAPENDLQESFKHTERSVDVAGIERL